MPRPLLPFLAFSGLLLAGCGGGGGGNHTDATKSVSISAPSTTLLPGGTVAFTAFVDGGGKVAWSATGGTITSSGVYTAPTAQGAYTVTATVGGKAASKTVTVTTGVAATLTSSATTPLTISKSTLAITGAVTGSSDQTITWTVKDASGTAVGSPVTNSGAYTFTAPDAAGTYTVTGTSHADATKTFSVPVTVAANVDVRISWTSYAGEAKGDVVLKMRPDEAPNTVANFVSLVNKGIYNGERIHRYVGNFVVQWGSPLSKTASLAELQDPNSGIGAATSTTSVPFEVNKTLHHVKYTLGAASTAAKGATGDQFFLNIADNTATAADFDPTKNTDLDPNYVVLAEAVSGQSVIDSLVAGDTLATVKTEAVSP